jgi:hypothetical protein
MHHPRRRRNGGVCTRSGGEPDDTLLSAPTVAYSLVRSNALLVVERYRENVPVLRHEALGFVIWRAFKRYGHPEEFFMPCDKAYPE